MFQPQLSVSAHHGFIYLDDGRLYGFGDNRYGQWGPTSGPGHPREAAAQIVQSGSDDYQYVLTDPNIKKIVCVRKTSFLLRTDGTVLVAGFIRLEKIKLNMSSIR